MLGFRVWDVEKKEFCGYREFVASMEGNLLEHDGTNMLTAWYSDKSFIPMQSTGIQSQGFLIKDRNYDFIYEGDIVKVECPDINHEYIFLVESIPHFYINLPYRQTRFIITILGDKYQNPELLEKLK